jgi:uncharacterized protein
MSIDPFPERVSPRKWCDSKGTINSSIPLGKLLRLSEYLDENHSQAEVCLSFDRDASGTCCLTGTVTARVSLECQRCLKPVTVDLESAIDIKVAANDADSARIAESAANPLDRLEIIVCHEGELNLLSVIEDELIMSLPIVASHADEQCSETWNRLHAKAQEVVLTGQANIKGVDVLEKLRQELRMERKQLNKTRSKNSKIGND